MCAYIENLDVVVCIETNKAVSLHADEAEYLIDDKNNQNPAKRRTRTPIGRA